MPKTRRGWDPNQQKRRLKLCTSHREIDLAITIRGLPRLVCVYWFPPILWFKLIRNLWHILFRSHRKLDWFLYGKERWFEILDAHHSLTVNMSVDVGARLSLWKYIEILNHPLSQLHPLHEATLVNIVWTALLLILISFLNFPILHWFLQQSEEHRAHSEIERELTRL